MKILFSKSAWDDVNEIVRIADKEVGMMGAVEYLPTSQTYYIHKIFLPKQEVSSVTTDLDATAMAELEHEVFVLQQNEKLPMNVNLNAWIHSHVNMDVMWSGTDKDTIKEMAHYNTNREGLCVAVVINKKGDTRGAVCYNSGRSTFAPSVFVDDVNVSYTYDLNMTENWEDKIKENVRLKSFSMGIASLGSKPDHDYTSEYWKKWDDDYMGKKSLLSEGIDAIGEDVKGLDEVEQWEYLESELWQMTASELIEDIDSLQQAGVQISTADRNYWLNEHRRVHGY